MTERGNTKEKVYIPVEMMHQFMVDTFVGVGVPSDDALISANVLIESDIRGIQSHGIGRLKMYYDRIKLGLHQAVTQFEIVREGPTTAVVDGHHGMGHVIAYKAMELAIQKAKTYGMGSVAVRNSTHFGIDGYYPLMAIKAGMIGMSFTNARPSISPTFGVQPKLGTNPIAFGCPTDEDFPFLFDAATSITQRGKIEVLDRNEGTVPPGWVIDQYGEYGSDPKAILGGLGNDMYSLLPLGGAGELTGGHKGYGLATMVEILSASLQSGAFLNALLGFDAQGNSRSFMLGHFFMAIDIESFVALDEFKHTTGEILRELRASKKAPGMERIFTAGEKEYYIDKEVREIGIEIVPNLQKDMIIIRKELGLFQYQLPF